MAYTSRSASSLVAKAEWPSCHRNSRERIKGTVCLNSQRTTLFHWFNCIGRSRCDRIQSLRCGYMPVSDVGRTASGSCSSDCPARVTHATSGAKPSRCSSSLHRYFFWDYQHRAKNNDTPPPT